ncbi:TetR/AcrR family transcriptional regulator [Celeribacter arenosi]|uniref:TetR/AcrR family transcriptional regulator n=1 Tax=Celeribacter arenosi TaxID=792649 RepID=A0ABP7JZE2_9RHOB
MINIKPIQGVALSIETSRIKRGRKFEQVVAGARSVFLREGFEGASVDEIAREAGVSKATLYSYFPDKRVLFVEIALREALRQAEAYDEQVDLNLPPNVLLPVAGRKLLDFMLSDLGQALYRVAVGESERFPEIGRKFYENGPKLVRDRISEYLSQAAARGEVRIDDFDLAAEQFLELCKVRAVTLCTFQPRVSVDAAERDKIIRNAVDMFLSHYGVKS